MTTIDPQREDRLRQGFKKYLNPGMLLLWRLGLGSWLNAWPDIGGRIMVITHTGRKTGRRRRTPVNYATVDGEVYCTAAFGGVSDWYRNVRAHPEIQVWLPDGWWAGVVEEVPESDAQWLTLMRQVLIGSGIVAPLFGVHPKRSSDEELREITAGYRLLHIRRTEARTGRDGPGDLAWVWPMATLILVPLVFWRRCPASRGARTRR